MIDKIAWLIVQESRILAVRSTGKDTYYLPGGKREPGETDQETLIREIEEELSVQIQPASIAYYGAFEAQAHGKPEGTIVRLTCYTGDFAGELKPASEIAELAWLTYQDRDKVSEVNVPIFEQLYKEGRLK